MVKQRTGDSAAAAGRRLREKRQINRNPGRFPRLDAWCAAVFSLISGHNPPVAAS